MIQNKKYMTKKYQTGGQEAIDFLNKFADSKRGIRMLKRSTKDKKDFENHYNNRKKNLNDSTFEEFDPKTFEVDLSKTNIPTNGKYAIKGITRISRNDPDIAPKVFINKDSNNKPSTYVHETSHAQDYGGLNIPSKDVQFLDNMFKDNNPMKMTRLSYNKWYNGDINKNSEKTYVADPTETRARINEVRKQMVDNNIRNVFNKKVRVKDLRNYQNNYNISKKYDIDGTITDNPLNEIEKGYSLDYYTGKKHKKELRKIKKMFNTISDNSNVNTNNYAKFGGQINDLQMKGYKSDSPYKHLKNIKINSDTIDTNNMAHPALLLVNDKGQKQIVYNNSGNITMNGSKYIVEYPIRNESELNHYKKQLNS